MSEPGDGETRISPIRILIAKPGLDGHDRGAKVLVRALRDAGFEVVYTGLFQTPEMIATAALQEDVQVIGLSILSGAHMSLFPRIMDELKMRGLDDVLVVAGGTIPKTDIPEIKALGVSEVFGPGTRLSEIVDFIRQNAPAPSTVVVTAEDLLRQIRGPDRRVLPRLRDSRGKSGSAAAWPRSTSSTRSRELLTSSA